MAEKINIYNSYHKDITLTITDEYGNEKPMDLSLYDINHVVFKKDRLTLDEDSYFIKKIVSKDNSVNIYLSPEETTLLPLTNEDLPFFYMFVVIGSSYTGENREIGAYKVKTQISGFRKWVPRDTDLSELGNILDPSSFEYDCGKLCDFSTELLDLGGGEPYVYNMGAITDSDYTIDDLGKITEASVDEIDNGYIQDKGDCYAANY